MARCLGLSANSPDRLMMDFTVPNGRPAMSDTSLIECWRRSSNTRSRCSLVNLKATPCCSKSVISIGCLHSMYEKNGGYSGYAATTPL